MLAIKYQVQTGQYRVDARLVADAILARMRHRTAPEAPAQKACSKPEMRSCASRKTTSGGPSTTDPTQVISPLLPRHC